MRPSYRLGVVLAFVLQVGLLGWVIVDRAMLLQNGKEIRLAVVPVDPHDLFRGDYVTLNYAISRLEGAKLAGDKVFATGDTIYVALADGVDGLTATSITHEAPANGLFLKGAVRDASNSEGCTEPLGCWTYMVDYNLEKFFVPEGTGRELETLRNDQRVSVDVAVAGDGRAALKRLLVDGASRYQEGLY
jgi:uncharacterized membrane-anchored protein